jgi:hypothetical protein
MMKSCLLWRTALPDLLRFLVLSLRSKSSVVRKMSIAQKHGNAWERSVQGMAVDLSNFKYTKLRKPPMKAKQWIVI